MGDSSQSHLRAVRTSADAMSDAALMRAVARGDQEAFAVLYDRLTDRVYGVVRRVVRDPARSEEVAQEVFVEAWRQARRYDPDRAAVSTWILTIAHRRAVDCVRSTQAARDRDEAHVEQDRSRPYDAVEEVIERDVEHEQVRRALGELTELQRESIELAYYEGNTYREVAEVLDKPLGTIKTRIRDGLIRLRDTLGVTDDD